MFRLKSIKNEDKDDIIVSHERSGVNNNYYTIVTGENGCGKSSLLSKAVNTYIFNGSERTRECTVINDSCPIPSRVIAICNARYNRFALRRTFNDKSKVSYPNYYIQTDQNIEVGKSLIATMHDVLREIICERLYNEAITPRKSPEQIQRIRAAFNMVGVQPYIKIDLIFNKPYIQVIKRINQAEIDGRELNESIYKSYEKQYYLWRKMAGVGQDVINFLLDFYNSGISRNSIAGVLSVNLDEMSFVFLEKTLPVHYIHMAIAVGILCPSKLQVQRTDSLKLVSNHSLSSGQQSMLMNAIIISVFSKKDTLICIDEPENSLHPEWQLYYMSFLNDLCQSDLGCHFLIATHSPQIISGIQSDNGCIVSIINDGFLSKNKYKNKNDDSETFISAYQELHTVASYRRKSVNRQLVDVFKSPGFSNDSIIHRLILILTKLTKKIKINSNDKYFLNEIDGFIRGGRIDEFDPALVVYQQILAISKVGEGR
ncbi:TPA: AAA family ATPase [Raoultella ornithinolytica]|nr:ATP-binding protein [Raoultella ornithinolytica]